MLVALLADGESENKVVPNCISTIARDREMTSLSASTSLRTFFYSTLSLHMAFFPPKVQFTEAA